MPTNMACANEILRQLGGSAALKMMIGAKSFLGDENSLSIGFPASGTHERGNRIKVIYDRARDTYSVEYWRVSMKPPGPALLDTVCGIYNDNLRQVCERMTGLYWSPSALGIKKKVA